MYIYTKYIYSKSYIFAKNGILSYGYPARIIRLSYDFISTLYDKSSLVSTNDFQSKNIVYSSASANIELPLLNKCLPFLLYPVIRNLWRIGHAGCDRSAF